MSRFTRSLLIFSSILFILITCWNVFIHSKYSSLHAPYIVIYFFLLTLVLHRFLMKANAQSPQHFVRSYMGLTALKLMINLLVIILYIFIDRERALGFTLFFLVIYFAYLIFEIISLQKELRNK